MNKDQAILNFMINTLNAVYPLHNEFPFSELREIEENEGDESEKWQEYPEHVIRAYWMKRDIEIISNNTIYF
jgi:hypothetical protein